MWKFNNFTILVFRYATPLSEFIYQYQINEVPNYLILVQVTISRKFMKNQAETGCTKSNVTILKHMCHNYAEWVGSW